MPYVHKEIKDAMVDAIERLGAFIQDKGDLNYAICELTGRFIIQEGEFNYTDMSEKIDAVHDAEAELRRRLLVPYEELKIKENGDVPSFVQILEKVKG